MTTFVYYVAHISNTPLKFSASCTSICSGLELCLKIEILPESSSTSPITHETAHAVILQGINNTTTALFHLSYYHTSLSRDRGPNE